MGPVGLPSRDTRTLAGPGGGTGSRPRAAIGIPAQGLVGSGGAAKRNDAPTTIRAAVVYAGGDAAAAPPSLVGGRGCRPEQVHR
jgi:hypothetical protein